MKEPVIAEKSSTLRPYLAPRDEDSGMAGAMLGNYCDVDQILRKGNVTRMCVSAKQAVLMHQLLRW